MPQLAQIIEFRDPVGDVMAVRLPAKGDGVIEWGSQLIVREGQVALLFKDGQMTDTFPPGRHTLETQSLPVLTKLLSGMAYGLGKTPFRAEVYFVGRHLFRDLRWGTREPVYVPDPVLIQVPIRGNGRFAVRVEDPSLFVTRVVGTRPLFRTADVEDFLRSQYLTPALTSAAASLAKPLAELPRHYRELVAGVRSLLASDFLALGLELTDLSVNSITTTEEVQALLTGNARTAGQGHARARAMQFELEARAAAGPADEVNVRDSSAGPEPGPAQKIRQLKELLDAGAVTQEEFDAKKAHWLRQM